MNLSEAFGATIRRLREEKGISQETLAEASDLDRTFISMLERGVKQPTLRTLWAIAEALEVAPHAIIKKVEESGK